MKYLALFLNSRRNSLSLLLAFATLFLWIISLIVFLQVDVSSLNWLLILAIVLVRTFLHTGVFIVAHDAAHGLVCVGNSKVNALIGSISIWIYSLLPYRKFVEKHHLHHAHPGTPADPDFHDGVNKGPSLWYAKFMSNYLDWKQVVVLIVWMSIFFHIPRIFLHISGAKLFLVWIIPLCLSSVQMFYFGTYLTHRENEEGFLDDHHAVSIKLPLLFSFLTSYHFGHHWEHHEYPYLPWFMLPFSNDIKSDTDSLLIP